MRWVDVAWWPLLAAGLVSWGMPGDRAGAEEPKAGFDKIVLGSSGGITGRGSGKGLTVEAQGQIVTKARDKRKKGELKAEELEQLKKLVAAVDWKGLKPAYVGKGADFFVDDLAVTIGGATSSVAYGEETQVWPLLSAEAITTIVHFRTAAPSNFPIVIGSGPGLCCTAAPCRFSVIRST